MSTRAQIGFYEREGQDLDKPVAMVYKHSDGYPEGVLPLLEEFLNKDGARGRRSDMEYLSAWYLYFLIKDHVKFMKEISDREPEDFLGHGISDCIHGDIEYLYAVYPDKVVIYDGNLNEIETKSI